MKSSVFFCVVFLIFVTPLFSQTDWTRHTGNPVLPVGPPGSWDDEAVLHPSIYFDGTTYHMWYSGYDGTNVRIGYATSPDGIVWAKYAGNPVLDIGVPGSWDDYYAYLPTVVFLNSTYHMWYTGNDQSYERIGHATSPDGITWTKDPSNPVINLGSPGSWYDEGVGTGFVMLEGSTLHLWFDGYDGTYFRIGHAISTDGGASWLFYPNPVLNIGSWDNPRVQSPGVVYNSVRSEYYMLYAGGDFFDWEIGYASSQNINGPWTKPTNESLFKKGGAGTWESLFVAFPYVIFDSANNIYKMWYTGGDASYSGSIGYATSPINLSDTLHVPGDYSTIQAAIDASFDGDLVLVADGTYLENINFSGKAITVASNFLINGDSTHIENTIIDGSQPANPNQASVVRFFSGEDTTSVLSGFTITGGGGTITATSNVVGGGIYIYHSGAFISNNIIIDNNIFSEDHSTFGGGIFCSSDTLDRKFVHISGNTIINNEALSNNVSGGYGGGIDIYGSDFIIENNKIIKNRVSGSTYCYGPGIRIVFNTEKSIIRNNNISLNSPINGMSNGGGLMIVFTRGVRVFNNHFEGNSGTWGAGIFDWSSNGNIISGNYFINNNAEQTGGGIQVSNSNSLIENNLLDRNISLQGAGIYLSNVTESQVINNTIVGNSASFLGGGIYNQGSMVLVLNTILWDNIAPQDSQIHIQNGTVEVRYSDVQGGWEGKGNIDVNPLFSDTLFHLSDLSLCIGAGIESIDIGGTMYYCPPFCYDGNPRPNPSGSKPDIGACESPRAIPVGVKDDLTQLPDTYSLAQNYPNPFNPTTTIVYGLRERAIVELIVYDVLGREIETIVGGEQNAGYYEIEFKASRLASGIYFYRLQAGSFVLTKKMIILK